MAITMRVDLRRTIVKNMNNAFSLVENDIDVQNAFDFAQSQVRESQIQGDAKFS